MGGIALQVLKLDSIDILVDPILACLIILGFEGSLGPIKVGLVVEDGDINWTT